jgi:hypothetical protein
MSKFRFGKNTQFTAALALLILLGIVIGCGGSKPEIPAESVSQGLVKSTLADFADAVDKGDFTSFRDKASKDFQATYTVDQMKTVFKVFIDKKDQTVPILKSAAGMNPTFSTPPAIREEKGLYILVLKGTMATTPAKTRFDNEYVWRDNSWLMLKSGTFLE